ncbi:beta-carotene 15,15'-monooxygenase [Halobacteriales archaeon SW_7_68_16]|nr:MAG: beta-carotene 15,15'-monooxygenase [Halobacteriales archaeon SW_7_68_16]
MSDADADARSHASDTAPRETVLRAFVVPGWLVCVLAPLPFLLGLSVPRTVQYVPLVVSGLLFGMPHGAVDHLAVARVSGRPFWPVPAIAVAIVYGVLGGLYLAAWFVIPLPAAVLFVVLTWLHWGQGDVYLLDALGDGYPGSSVGRVLALVVRGAMPMAVPLVAFPAEYQAVVTDFVGLFDAGAAVEALFAPDVRLALAAGLVVLTGLSILAGWLAAGGDVARLDALELGLLWVLFLSVPPVLAVGLYFCLWHALRHVARLALVDDRGRAALTAGRPVDALRSFARDAAPLTVVSLGFVAALYPLVPETPETTAEAVALYLVVVAALTLPHALIVSYMDYEQGVWARSTDG